MAWIIANIGNLMALLGALYGVARVIVILTPTPRDNDALERVGPVIKALCAAFGMRANQGISADDTPSNILPLPDKFDAAKLPKRGDGEWGGKPPG